MSGSTNIRMAGTFGAITFVANDKAVILGITSRNYDTYGFLHVDHAHIRLPVNDAIRLHAILADLIVAAEATEIQQTGIWSEATSRSAKRVV